jgi:kynurenine formamidase
MAQSGIGARAYFLDWYRWATKIDGQTIDTTSPHAIPFSELHSTATHQGLSLATMRAGDVLIIRSGYLAQYASMSDAKRKELDDLYETTKPSNIGVEASPELLQFLWDKQVAAVAGDARSFEAWPCREEKKEWHLHQWLLAGWGMPIGELWDLEALSELAERLGRWTFFLSSAPMNVPGGVASPANALAFF